MALIDVMTPAALLLMRAPGWNVGTARELGGAVVDAAMRGVITAKVAYAMSLPLVAMAWGAAYQYFKTGELPEFAPADRRQTYVNFTKSKTGRILPAADRQGGPGTITGKPACFYADQPGRGRRW
jgi:hypothetical protein